MGCSSSQRPSPSDPNLDRAVNGGESMPTNERREQHRTFIVHEDGTATTRPASSSRNMPRPTLSERSGNIMNAPSGQDGTTRDALEQQLEDTNEGLQMLLDGIVTGLALGYMTRLLA